MSLVSFFEGKLCRYAAQTIARERPFVVTVSGTVGKSTAKQAIAAVLGANDPAQHVRVTAKNYNNQLGVPLTVFGHKAPGRSIGAWLSLLWDARLTSLGLKSTGIKIFCFEMGTDQPGDFDQLLSIAKPNLAVITAITPDDTNHTPSHTANFASIDALAEEESKPVRVLTNKDGMILNADDKRAFGFRHLSPAHETSFGESDAADIRLVKSTIRVEKTDRGNRPIGIDFNIESFNRPLNIFVPTVFGRSAGYALCAAMAVAEALDIDPFVARQRLEEHFEPMKGRTRIIPGIKHTALLDDSYNASPVAVLSALRDLASIPVEPHQRRIACLGEMRELGERSAEMHRLIGAEAAKLKLDLLVACGTLATVIQEGALANGMSSDQVQVIEDTPEAGLFLQDVIRPGDIILAKASEGTLESKGVRMERVIKELMAEPLRAQELLVRQEDAWKRR